MRAYLPLLRVIAIVADLLLLAVIAAFLLAEGFKGSAEGVAIIALAVVAAGGSVAFLLQTKPDAEERQLEADVRKAELRKRLRELSDQQSGGA